MKIRLSTLVASLAGVAIAALLRSSSVYRTVNDVGPLYHGPSSNALFVGFAISLVIVGVLIGVSPVARRVSLGWLMACSAATIVLATALWPYTAGGSLFVVFHVLPFWGRNEPSPLFMAAGQLAVLVLTGWLFGWLLITLVAALHSRKAKVM